MSDLTNLQQISIMLLPLLFAITLHEVAHGWVASLLGDDTARKLGRISLNPFKHIDLLGTLLVPILMYVSTGFIFGWAKPVPVDFGRLHRPRRDMALVALAGPAANLLMMLFWGLLARLGMALHSTGWDWAALPLVYAGGFGLMINAVLMVLNLFPLPPLDGGRVLVSLLPRRLALGMSRLESYGIIILLILLFTGLLWQIVGPLVSGSQQWMALFIETLT